MSDKKSTVFVDDATGEVISKPKFRSMWCNPFGIIQQDYSNPFEEVFEEIPPYALDPKTGKLLNETSQPILISKGKINVWEKIQSFRDEVDLYKILEKFAYSGDQSILNARACSYGDISNLPDNINDYAAFVDKHIDNLKAMNLELAKKVLDDNISSLDIENEANKILNNRVEALKKNNESEDK